MEFTTLTCDLLTKKTDCLIIALGQEGSENLSLTAIDKATGGLVSRLQKSGDIKNTIGSSLLINEPSGLAAQRLLIIGYGKTEADEQSFLKLTETLAETITKLPIKSACLALDALTAEGRDQSWVVQQLARKLTEGTYLFNPFKSKDKKKPSLTKITLAASSRKGLERVKQAVKQGKAIANGVNLARELGDLPGNICTPSYLASEARKLAKKHPKLTCKVLSEKQMQALGMGSLLSVAAGSVEPAKLVILEYRGGKTSDQPIVLVGKGVTFDSGGISLKPGAAMDEMKYDMCGAASVLGTFSALVDTELPINVVGIIPTVENMPSGNATKPGDIVKSMSGQTIEILNTDAEGRLILCDALTYAGRYKPKSVIDIATLTGACVMALGSHASGMLSNNDPLAEQLETAGKTSGDRLWRLPLWDDYDKQLKSNFADMANIGGRPAGTITAACFLGRFTKDYQWAHIDIAGTAWNSGNNKGATGRPVPLLTEYLLAQVKQ